MSFSTKASSRTHLWSAASTSLMPAYRKAAVGRFKWKDSLTFDTRFVPGLWPVASEWIWKWGGAIFLVVPLHFFGLKVQLVVSVSAFVMVSTVWPVSCLLFTVHPPCPVESAPLFVAMLWVEVIRHWHSQHWHGCLALGSHTHQSFASTPFPIFWKLIGFASISRLALAPVGGGGQVAPVCPPWRR